MDVDEAINFALDNPNTTVVVNFDEVNRATSDVISGVMTAYTSRKLARPFPENVRFMCTGNDRGDIIPMDSAAITRLSLYRVTPSADTWLAYMESVSRPAHWAIAEVLTNYPHLIFCKPALPTVDQDDDDDRDADLMVMDADDLNSMTQFTAPRTLTYLSDWMNLKGDTRLRELFYTPSTDTNKSLLQVFVESKVGFTEFTTKLMETLTTKLSQVVQTNAQTARVPLPTEMATNGLLASISAATSYDVVEQTISTATPNEVTALVLYLLTNQPKPANVTNERVIVSAMTKLNGNLTGSAPSDLVKLKAQGDLDANLIDLLAQQTSPTLLGLNMLLQL